MINHAFKSNFFPCYPQKIALTTRLVGNCFHFIYNSTFFHNFVRLFYLKYSLRYRCKIPETRYHTIPYKI